MVSAEDVRALLNASGVGTACSHGSNHGCTFKFQPEAYCRAIDSRLKDLLLLGETRDVAAMHNIHVDLDTRALSAQL